MPSQTEEIDIGILCGDSEAHELLERALARRHLSCLSLSSGQPIPAHLHCLITDSGSPGWQNAMLEFARHNPHGYLCILCTHNAERHAPNLGNEIAVRWVSKPFAAGILASDLVDEVEQAKLRKQRNELIEAAQPPVPRATFAEARLELDAAGRILFAGSGTILLYGRSPDELVGRMLFELDPQDKLEAIGRFERRRKHSSGDWRTVLISRRPRLASDGSIEGYTEFSVDQSASQKIAFEWEHASRLADLGKLAAGLAHEINNPLAVIQATLGHLETLNYGAITAEVRECFDDMDLAARRIHEMVSEVGNFARAPQRTLHEVSLRETVEIARRLSVPRALRVGVSIVIEDTIWPTVAQDPGRLSQAILNLLSNAIDAAAKGGKEVIISAELDNQFVRLSIQDNGLKVEEKALLNAFEPFITGKAPGEGTGLGLPIANQIARDHDGWIELLPREEGGVLATLTLPTARIRQKSIFPAPENS